MSQQSSKDIILDELNNITDQQDITDIYNAVNNRSEENKQKINAINVASNGVITYWFVNVSDPLNNPQQVNITLQEINRFRLNSDAFLIRVNLTGANVDQIVLSLLNIVGNLYLFGYNITDQQVDGSIRTFRLTKVRSSIKDQLID